MRNVDKYLTELLSKSPNWCDTILKLRAGEDCHHDSDCKLCEKLNKEWLEAEYVEPEVDWSKVPMGTPVRVWDINGIKHQGRYVIFRQNCNTYVHEVLLDGRSTTEGFRYAELIEVDND